jgi:hypothetical protein
MEMPNVKAIYFHTHDNKSEFLLVAENSRDLRLWKFRLRPYNRQPVLKGAGEDLTL